jgi:putative transcriptional regulator
MKEKEFCFSGIIDKDYKKKFILKMNSVLIPIFALITLFLVSATLGDSDVGDRARGPAADGPISNIIGVSDLLFWLILFVVILPYLIIMIISSISISTYIRNYTFEVSESNITIYHGVFTKTKATIPILQVQNISIVSGIFDRMFKLYTVKIETAGAGQSSSGGAILRFRPEGQIPGLKEPNIIEDKINEMIKKFSQGPVGLQDKLFKPEDLAFDNFISYILSKIREGEKLNTRIKELREKASLTGAKLAEKVGVPIQTISYLEEGRYNPSLTLAYKIAQVLNCKIEDLFELT